MSGKIYSWLTTAVICSLLLTVGCAPLAEEGATLALKFTPQDSTTYKFTTEAQRSIKWEGPVPDKSAFKGGRNENRVEITFTQQVQSIDETGNAVAKITIKGLKYFSVVKDNLTLDFDSSREKDRNNPLAKLIGQSYTIEIAPTGKVSDVIDVIQAQAAVRGSSAAHKTALALLQPGVIKERHGIVALPVTDKNKLNTGDNWSSVKTLNFGLMGSKSYEKIYTVKEIIYQNKRKVAIVEMNAIPSSEMAEQLHKEQAPAIFSKMFDNPVDTYSGRLELDLTAGKVEKYLEELRSEWVAVDPTAGQKADKEPAAVKMSATRLYSLEKID